MITEDYVSFETAKLLKEKGFDEGCRLHYHYVEAFNKYFPTDESISGFEQYYYPCPTLQMVMKWLRETYDTFISVEPGAIFGMFDVYVYYDNYTKLRIIERNKDNYEEACEEAIKYCLENLI